MFSFGYVKPKPEKLRKSPAMSENIFSNQNLHRIRDIHKIHVTRKIFDFYINIYFEIVCMIGLNTDITNYVHLL